MFSSDLPGPPALLCWGPQQATRARSEPSQFPSENEHIAHPSPRCSERIGRWDRSGAPGGRETESRAAPSAPALYAGLQLLSSGGLFQTRLQQGPKYPGKSIIGQSCQPLSGFLGMRLCCPEPDAVPALPEPLPPLILGSGPPAAARPPPILPDPPTLRGQICLPLGSLPAPPSPSAPLLSLAGPPDPPPGLPTAWLLPPHSGLWIPRLWPLWPWGGPSSFVLAEAGPAARCCISPQEVFYFLSSKPYLFTVLSYLL